MSHLFVEQNPYEPPVVVAELATHKPKVTAKRKFPTFDVAIAVLCAVLYFVVCPMLYSQFSDRTELREQVVDFARITSVLGGYSLLRAIFARY